MSWPMAEKLFIRALNDGLARGRAGARLPGKAENLDGFVRVSRGPGGDDGVTDTPLIDLEAFHTDQSTAWEIAEDARQIMLSLVGTGDTGHLIDSVETASGPARVEYGTNLERYTASYRVGYRQ